MTRVISLAFPARSIARRVMVLLPFVSGMPVVGAGVPCWPGAGSQSTRSRPESSSLACTMATAPEWVRSRFGGVPSTTTDSAACELRPSVPVTVAVTVCRPATA